MFFNMYLITYILLSQIDQKGSEGRLEKAFANAINSFRSPFVKLVPFYLASFLIIIFI